MAFSPKRPNDREVVTFVREEPYGLALGSLVDLTLSPPTT
jgi:hypothetical protein